LQSCRRTNPRSRRTEANSANRVFFKGING
jgi:hypothetical protein